MNGQYIDGVCIPSREKRISHVTVLPQDRTSSGRGTISYLVVALLLLSSLLLAASPPANAQAVTPVEIGSGSLDRDNVTGPRWERIAFDPLVSGTQVIRVTWDGNADIRFSLFEASGTTPFATPADSVDGVWTGTLDGAGQYVLSVWARSGAANYTATIETATGGTPGPVNAASIGQGTLDSTRGVGPRYTRLRFNSLASARHTITVSWNSSADVRFNVFGSNGTAISQTIRGSNPGVWSGELDANQRYFIGLWSTDGVANYSATLETAPEATVPLSLTRQPSGLSVTEGENATFTVEASGSGALVYQWFADGSPLSGETADSLTVFSASASDDGTGYTVEVGNGVDTVTSEVATLTVEGPPVIGLFSESADTSAWMLAGPAPTLDYLAGPNTDAFGDTLLRVGDVLLVGGDFTGIKPRRAGPVTARPFLAALDAISGQPVTTFQVPPEVDSVVRALVISPDRNRVYIGGDFGLLVVDAVTGELAFAVDVADGTERGRVFDIAVTRSQVYIGGDFNRVNGRYRVNIARLSLDGDLDPSWAPRVRGGVSKGRAAPVQVVTISPAEDVVYVGGSFASIDSTPVQRLPGGGRNSILTLDASDGAVRPERFMPSLGSFSLSLAPFDIAVTDSHVIIVCGAPNILTFYSTSGVVLRQIFGTGDTQALQIAGDYVFVGHHGEYFFDDTFSPIPSQAVPSLSPRIVVPYKLHSFRISDGSFEPVQAWRISGAFGVWGIVADEDAIWVAGQIFEAGANERRVDGLVRFPALP